ncbi:MAG: lipid-A-disaccharide synthase [Rhizobium sp.]|nr:lipid-A-disaccharide synthase [Rhizobium sp.]
MTGAPLTVAIVAGESSGDLLGADLIAALKVESGRQIALVGVGGPALSEQGLTSLFHFSEIAIMGFVAVVKKLPRLLSLIGRTADAIIAARPDVLIIIDSPDFTHRVAKKVRKALPDLPVVNYVCPSVWAWKEYRAPAMRAYVDHVLAVLPFEPEAMARLDGPPTTYIGHRLRALPELLQVRETLIERRRGMVSEVSNILLLPGSRNHEIRRLLPIFGETIKVLASRGTHCRLLLATVPYQQESVRELTQGWQQQPEIFVGEAAKWQAFAEADVALAASGTVLLELALAGIPTISTYKTDVLIRMVLARIKAWSGALPNLIADYPVVPEYFDEFIRPTALARWLERLGTDTPDRAAMLTGFQEVFDRMATERAPGEHGAAIILDLLHNKKTGHS